MSANIKSQRTGTYDVVMSAYCGMSYKIAEDVELSEAKESAKRARKRARARGCHVEKIGKGEYEIQTPEEADMVDDSEGILTIRPRYRRYRVIFGRKHYID